MIPKSYSILNFKIIELVFKAKQVLEPELSFTLTDSKTSQEIYRSPISLVSQLINLPPVQIEPDILRSPSLSFYLKTAKGVELLGSASFDLSKKFPMKKSFNIKKTIGVKIEINKGEAQLPEFAQERPDINTADVAVLAEELRKGLTKYDFKSPDDLEEAIETTRRSITVNQKIKKHLVKFEEEKLADLEWLLSSRNKVRSNSLLIINPIEIATQKKIDVIEGLMDDLKVMPSCAEKFLTSILCYSYYKSYNFDPELYIHRKVEVINPNIEFSNFIEFLKQKGEDDVPEDFRKHFENQEWEKLISETEKILKDYRPVNVKEMSRLIKKSAKNSGELENKDIILLIGATGSGKSTTTHFLCGSNMEVVKEEDGITGIKATFIHNPALKSTVISSGNHSETRYITHIPINLADAGETIFLCDTPGLMDTSGPEVDMANTISIVEYVKKCRSVRPLILLSSKNEGDRFEGVQKLAQTLGRIITDFNKYSISFTYAFTKYKKSDASNIHGKVNRIISSQENNNTAFFHILKDIRDKTRDGALTINPIKDDHQELLRKIMERDPILDPKNAFERFITEESRGKLEHQVDLSKGEIDKALNSLNYEMIRYKLDELQYIGALFSEFEPK
ncbi:unnamed protein product [Blepharisma stoltei]|uniref:G domain-containing protein n=1 Tax=Blepharisma stoltei TaxID=1481888 RepID=A0AAU9IQF8_9CILI|nr:unnamed protein product [Blepharisma stoltei]